MRQSKTIDAARHAHAKKRSASSSRHELLPRHSGMPGPIHGGMNSELHFLLNHVFQASINTNHSLAMRQSKSIDARSKKDFVKSSDRKAHPMGCVQKAFNKL